MNCNVEDRSHSGQVAQSEWFSHELVKWGQVKLWGQAKGGGLLLFRYAMEYYNRKNGFVLYFCVWSAMDQKKKKHTHTHPHTRLTTLFKVRSEKVGLLGSEKVGSEKVGSQNDDIRLAGCSAVIFDHIVLFTFWKITILQNIFMLHDLRVQSEFQYCDPIE